MPRFFFVRATPDTPKKQYDQGRYFATACRELGIEYVEVIASTVTMSSAPVLQAGDLLYRASVTTRSALVERMIMRSGVITFRQNEDSVFYDRRTSFFKLSQDNIPVIPTYPLIPQSWSEREEALDTVGGFPLIFKVLGGSHGVGVIKVDSLESFKSVIDYFIKTDKSVLIRKFITHEYSGRLIVVGDKVVASYRNLVLKDEFRSNSSDNTDKDREPFNFGDETNAMVVKAVHISGLEFGGVDIIVDQEGKPFVAEINFPCQFEVAHRVTGVDVASAMVQYLLDKSRL